MLPEAWYPGCYLSLEAEAKELPSPQGVEVLVLRAKAPALNPQCPTGADSCDGQILEDSGHSGTVFLSAACFAMWSGCR